MLNGEGRQARAMEVNLNPQIATHVMSGEAGDAQLHMYSDPRNGELRTEPNVAVSLTVHSRDGPLPN